MWYRFNVNYGGYIGADEEIEVCATDYDDAVEELEREIISNCSYDLMETEED